MTEVVVRDMAEADWPAVRDIYIAGIAARIATFETEAPSWEAWDKSHRRDLRFVATEDDEIRGWVAASDVSDRCCYAGVVEHSIYVDPVSQGRGVGRVLLSAFVAAAEEAGIWTIESGIFPENVASIALHKSCGFRVVGHRERLGQLDGEWRDVLLLERRSTSQIEIEIEIACTLTADDQRTRGDEWREAIRSGVVGSARHERGRLRLTLRDDAVTVSEVVDLARREKACCAFFDFNLEIDANDLTLVIGVPSGAESILDELAALAPSAAPAADAITYSGRSGDR